MAIRLSGHAHTHVISLDHADLGGGQVDPEGVLPVGQQLQDTAEQRQREVLSHEDSPTSHQGEVVRVDPDDAEVGLVRVLLCHLLQDVKELKTI